MLTPDDLAAAQHVASARWRADGPYVDQHVGDLAWGANPTTGREHVALHRTGRGYAFDPGPGEGWSLEALPGAEEEYGALAGHALAAGRDVYALGHETAKLAALRAHGFRPGPGTVYLHLVHDLDDLRPVGAAVVTGATDLDARVALHRAAWEPSKFTRETYDGVRATPPYDPDLDVVALSPDGEWAAYCIGWYDAGSASGELEPVGAAPAFRRQGYAAAACLAALHRLRERGARTAVVYAVDDAANPGPRALYESIGFRVADRHVRYLPPARQNAGTPRGGSR